MQIGCELEEEQGSEAKSLKMEDLEAVFQSKEQLQIGEEMSGITTVPMAVDLNVSQAERGEEVSLSIGSLDLNSDPCAASNSEMKWTAECADKKVSLVKEHDGKHKDLHLISGGLRLELGINAEAVTSSLKKGSVKTGKNCDNLRFRNVSECGSTTGPVEEKDPLKVWREMKQNGFLSPSNQGMSFGSGLTSSSHGGIPMPKQRGRKKKSDTTKKRKELADNEQVNKFAKIAAPSGLLRGLNPGIINHVRNRKQVYSIITAMVKSEKQEKERENKAAEQLKRGGNTIGNPSEPEIHELSSFHGLGISSKQIGRHTSVGEEGDSTGKDGVPGRDLFSHSTAVGQQDEPAMKLSSSTKASDESSAISNEESLNISSVSSLSVRAASVAFQWLVLIHHDINGRLSALRRSKKRVQSVISTELPYLTSKEFSSNQENNHCVASTDGLSASAVASLHQRRWTALFDHMDKALSEEEKQLENLLNQVKEMQQHCDQGLQHFLCDPFFESQQHGISETYTRIRKADSSEKELAVRAAAASIYSTCNFLELARNMS